MRWRLSLKRCGIPICVVTALLHRLAIEGGPLTERPAMFTPEHFRAKAAEHTELAKTTDGSP